MWKFGFIFGHFSYVKGDFLRKPPSRQVSWKLNRFELDLKWPHYKFLITRTITYVQTKEIQEIRLDPPPIPLIVFDVFYGEILGIWYRDVRCALPLLRYMLYIMYTAYMTIWRQMWMCRTYKIITIYFLRIRHISAVFLTTGFHYLCKLYTFDYSIWLFLLDS